MTSVMFWQAKQMIVNWEAIILLLAISQIFFQSKVDFYYFYALCVG